MAEEIFLNSDNDDDLAAAIRNIKSLRGTGKYRIEVKKFRNNRSLEQLALWWAGFVRPFHSWLHDDCGNEHITAYMSHRILKKMFLEKVVFNEKTGDPMVIEGSTGDLDVDEFSALLEKVGAFFVNETGIRKFGSNKKQFWDIDSPSHP